MWDARLVKGYYLMESMDVEGHPIWVEEAPGVRFEAKRRKIKSLAALEAAQETFNNSKNKEKGVRFYTVAKFPDGKRPTFRDWRERQSAKARGEIVDTSSEKVRARNAAAEERAKAKLAQMGHQVE